jgi:Mg-chelatase subunit ChlD
VAFSESEQPLELVLLFDTSSSMSRQTKKLPAVAREILQQLIPDDRVQVMTFSTEVQFEAPFSNDPLEVEDAIRRVVRIHASGGTRIQDAVYDAANQFPRTSKDDHMRRAVLAVTDNLGITSRHKATILAACV